MLVMLYGILNAARGNDSLSRPIMALLMALAWYSVHLVWWKALILFPAIWLAFMPGWSLCVIDTNQPRDWYKKFPPTKWFKINIISDTRLYGAAGMAIRWTLFMGATITAHGLLGIPIGLILAIGVGAIYWLAGAYWPVIDTKTRAAEYFSGIALGVALMS